MIDISKPTADEPGPADELIVVQDDEGHVLAVMAKPTDAPAYAQMFDAAGDLVAWLDQHENGRVDLRLFHNGRLRGGVYLGDDGQPRAFGCDEEGKTVFLLCPGGIPEGTTNESEDSR